MVRSLLSLLAVVLICAVILAADASGRPADAALPWTVGRVNALAVARGKLLVAADEGPARVVGGQLVAYTGAGTRRPRFPRIDPDGVVLSLAGDGRGGFYVGGNFARIGDVACPSLAHVTRVGRVDRLFCPRPRGGGETAVRTLSRFGSRLYIGGDFTRIAGAPRRNLAALDLRTGAVTGWRPAAPLVAEPSRVHATATALYLLAGDTFVAFDPVSGVPLPFAPDPDSNVHGDSVSDFVVAAGRVYAWGLFSRIGGEPRAGLAMLDARTGKALDWSAQLRATAGVAVGRVVYLGGLTRANGRTSPRIAAFDAASGRLLPWGAQAMPFADGPQALAAAGGVLHVTGESEAGDTRLLSLSLATGTALRAPAPAPPGAVVAATRNTVLVGGALPTVVEHSAETPLFAVDPTTKEPLAWLPRIDGSVDALAVNGGTLYVAGSFSHAGGLPRGGFAAFSIGTGRLLPWRVRAASLDTLPGLGATRHAVYAAENVGGSEGVFALDPRRGATVARVALPFNSSTTALAASDDVVFVADAADGAFAVAALEPQPLRLVASFKPRQTACVQALVADGRSVYAGGDFFAGARVKQPYLARLTLADGRLRVDQWQPRLPGPVSALASAGRDLVVAGSAGAEGHRSYVAVVNKRSADVRVVGYLRQVSTIAAVRGDVYVGGSFGLRLIAH